MQLESDSERSFLSVKDYSIVLKHFSVKTIIRLNEKAYDEQLFIQEGFQFHDFPFPDGSVPSDFLIYRFLAQVQEMPKPIAIHCKAGLGRTGTLICLFLMAFMGMKAREAIAWCRIMRQGSVIGSQQQFLLDKEKEMQEVHLQIQQRIPISFQF